MTAPKLGFITCVHPIYDLPSVARQRDQAIAALESEGCRVIAGSARDSRDIPETIALLKREDVDLLVFFFCTWVAEEIALALARELQDVPLLLWALPYFDQQKPMPSPMTGLTATGCNIRRLGRSYVHRVGAVTHEQICGVARTARIAAVVKSLRHARFGVLGSPCPGMIDTACDESLLQNSLGMTTVRRDLDNLLRARDESSPEEARRLAVGLMDQVGRSEVPLETVAAQYRLYLGMKSLVDADRLDGFSVRCWPELRDHDKNTICLTMAEMAARGVPSACEADLTALITSYILTRLADRPSYTLEITGHLEEQRALQMAHCGAAALVLAGDPGSAVIRSHMRTGTGAVLEFGFKPGVVTIAKLLRPVDGRLQMFIGRGEVIPTVPGTRGSVATVRVEPSPAAFLDAMLQNAVEHHLVVVYGDWTDDLAQFTRLTAIEQIRPSFSPPS